jgi:aminopeptidase N
MMIIRHISCLVFACLLCILPVSAEQKVQGVPHWLAEARASEISNVNYILTFNIPENKSVPVRGSVTILFDIQERQDVILDFQGDLTDVCMVNGKEREVEYEDEHIIIPKRFTRDGNNVVELTFYSRDQALNRNEDYMYTLFVPDHARSVFPCFDQPDMKATFSLELTVPEGWKTMVSCGTKPIPTYLFSFVAGRFQERTVNRDGRQLRALYRETDPQKLEQLDKIFDIAALSLRWMERYTDIQYPFDNYGFVILPGYQFGGMEHPGAIQFSDSRLFLGKNPTQDELLSRLELIAHETSHMWFGDLVTMSWFDDVWMKEVFANFLASKISREQMPEVSHDLNFLKMYLQPAIATDRTEGTHPIRQQLMNLNEASLLYGNIIYDKAPVVMQKLEELLGERELQEGLRQYLVRYAYSNASWDDLISLLDLRRPSADLRKFSDVWVKKEGLPIIHTEYQNGKIVITQTDPLGRGITWPQNFHMMLGNDLGTSKVYDVRMNRARVEIPVPQKPHFIIPNYDGRGYGLFTLNTGDLHTLCTRLMCTSEELPRYAMVLTLFDNYLMHRLPASYFGELYRMMEREESPLILSTVARQMRTIAFEAGPKERHTLELCMLDLTKVNTTPACRQNILKQLAVSASAPEILNQIYKIWQRGTDPIFSERDYMQMAWHLAIMRPREWRQIIQTQRSRLKNPDRQREFDFVSQACNPDRDAQIQLFQTLMKPQNRVSEPWVTQALALLCQDQREAQGTFFIAPGLGILQNIQLTGGIFFPTNWLSALLGWHKSREARQAVHEFLQQTPDYPPYLRRKIQEQAWPLLNRK